MERELQFRAWIPQEERMIDDDDEFMPLIVTNKGILQLSPEHTENLWSVFDGDIKLMQFTGLRDKHGIKIFEGDFLRWDKMPTVLAVVKFVNGMFMANDVPLYRCHDESVFGNIYQNPELFNG